MGYEILGKTVIAPFQRDKRNDFAAKGGPELVRAAVKQILGTRGGSEYVQGEVPWRTDFGSLLYLLKHMNSGLGRNALARTLVRDAFSQEPRARLKNVKLMEQDDNKLYIRVTYDIINENVPGNLVVLKNIEDEVEIL